MKLQYSEQPQYFTSGNETLFGVLTEPTGSSNGMNVLTICGGGWIPSPHRGSMWVRLARKYAEHGYRSYRFDYHGVGESTGSIFFDMDLPPVEDAQAALQALSGDDHSRTVFIGTCLGGRTAAALAHATNPAGVAFLAIPVLGAKTTADLAKIAMSPRIFRNLFKAEHRRQYKRIAMRRAKRIVSAFRARQSHGLDGKRRFIDDFELVVRRKTPCLFAYGAQDPEYAEFLEASKQGRLAKALERAGGLAQVVVVPGRLHGFGTAEAQQHVIDLVLPWIEDHVGPRLDQK